MKYEIKDSYFIKGKGKVYTVKFDKPYLRKELNQLLGTKLMEKK